MFKEIGEAYGVLSDEQKRARYDRFGPDGINGGGAGPGGVDFGGGVGLGDLFEVFFGGAGMGGRGPQADIRRGNDVRADVTMTLEESWSGATKEIKVAARVTCKTCDGSGAAPGTSPETCSACKGSGRLREVRNTFFGQFVQEAPCARCGGTGRVIPTPCSTCRGDGRVRGERQVTVAIPAGVGEGDRVRVVNAGEDGHYGGPPGDLYCFIYIEEHSEFQRRENDVLHVISLSYAQAALGDVVDVPTLELKDGEHVTTEISIPRRYPEWHPLPGGWQGLPDAQRPPWRPDLRRPSQRAEEADGPAERTAARVRRNRARAP
jgi:molecular chaperone DnaJ